MRRKEESNSVYLMNIIYKSHKSHRLGTMDPTSSNRPKQVSDGNRNENQQINIQHAWFLIKNPTNNNEWHIIGPEEPLPTTPRGRDDPQARNTESVGENGTKNSVQKLPGRQIQFLKRNPAKRNAPLSPERPKT